MLIISKLMLLLTMAFPFAVLAFLGYGLIADAGLLSVLTLVFFSLVPISPLPGISIAKFNKGLVIGMLLPMGFLLYGFMLQILPQFTYLIVGAVSAAVGSYTLYRLRKSTQTKTPTPPPPPPPPPP
jgi:hypothetical protein